MIFILSLILVTFAIAASAAFFSVYGLAHTFSGTFWGVVLMGSSLEAGKLMAASYLYRYWHKIHYMLKVGLLAVIVAVMLLTSGGIFGYLSSGYQAEVLPLKQKADQVKLLDDEKTRLLKRKIQIDDLLVNNSTELVTDIKDKTGEIDKRAVSALYASSRAKDRVAKQYKDEQVEITKRIRELDTQLLPLKQELIKAESHTGPIVYIAKALNADTDGAASYLIYLIIFAFDPMAILLTLAVNHAIKLRKEEKEVIRQEQLKKAKEDAQLQADIEDILHAHDAVPPIVAPPTQLVVGPSPIGPEIDIQHLIDEAVAQDRVERIPEIIREEEQNTDIELQLANELIAARDLLDQSEKEKVAVERKIADVSNTLSQMTESVNDLMPSIVALEEESSSLIKQNNKLSSDFNTIINEYDVLLAEKVAIEEKYKETEKILSEVLAYNVEQAENKLELEEENVTPVVTEPELVLVESPLDPHLATMIPVKRHVELPKLDAVPDNFPLGGNASFGTEFPNAPIKGDLFLRVDYMPSKLFKWSGTRWIEVDKSTHDSYAYNEEYIRLLVDKISSGEQDIDELNSLEQAQIQEYLQKQDNNG